MRLFSDAHYDFIGKRRVGYVISGITLAILIAAMLFFQFGRGSWLNYGVDFLGGTLVQVEVERDTDVNELRGVVTAVVPGSEVTRFGGEREYLVRAPVFQTGGVEAADELVQAMNEHYGAGQVTIGRVEAVGPKIGGELQGRAMMALAVSFLFTLVYLAFRFEWRFGVAAIIATLHDIVITVGIISLFRIEVSLPTVAAVLTIVGYSLNDTIIVFDRVRENLTQTGRRESVIDVLNRSINETLPRTVMTSATTVAALLSLFLLGGAIIRDFSLILIVGVLIGTYSSIMIASPALLEIQERWGERRTGGRKKEKARAAL